MQAESDLKSVRLGRSLRSQLRQAATVSGRSESELIREAVARHTDAILKGRLDRRLADVIGIARGPGGQAERTGEAFTELLVRQQRRR